jgi:hypothetical protein
MPFPSSSKVIMKTLGATVLGVVLATTAFAQTPAAPAPDMRQAHYQIGVMERVLEGAVEHGTVNFRDRLQAVFPDAPAQLLILDNPRVRGFRLDGYGVFFDVEVPSLNATLTWSLRTLDQNDLGLQSALNTLRTRLDPNDVDLQQALKRVELQVAPVAASQTQPASAQPVASNSAATPRLSNPRRATGSAASTQDRPVTATSVSPKVAQQSDAPAPAAPSVTTDDKVVENPNDVYRSEVIQALADAMLDYSGPLSVGGDEWLTIAARGIQDRPRVGPADNDGQTVLIRLRGADLAAFRAGQLSREQVMSRIERRVF